MYNLKFIVFIELLTLLVTACTHLFCRLFKIGFPLSTYSIMLAVSLGVALLAIFILVPFLIWFFDMK